MGRNSISIRGSSYSSTKPGLPPIWRARADDAGEGGGCASAFLTAITRTITLVAGLRLSGLVAQKAYDKPMNAATFEEWVEKCLVPTLSKGDVVVMDNLSSHKGPRVEQLIKAAGAELRYLPPYSPDMNPIEKAYSKLKAFLRKIAERTVAGLMNALEACAEIFKPAECVNYFKACGYDACARSACRASSASDRRPCCPDAPDCRRRPAPDGSDRCRFARACRRRW